MQIIHQPDQLILRSRSPLMGSVLALGALLALITVAGTAVWGMVDLSTQSPRPTFYPLRLLLLTLVFALGCFVAWAAATTAARVLYGITCTFDRTAATVRIVRWDGLRRDFARHSIYGVSHAQVIRNDEVRTLALYLVLRSGERIPLGVLHEFDASQAETVVKTVKNFLARG